MRSIKLAIAGLMVAALLPAAASAKTFSNGTVISLPSTFNEPANPYPSPIEVSGLKGPVSTVRVTLSGYNDSGPAADFMVVSPSGDSVTVWSDECSAAALNGEAFTLADDATQTLPGNCNNKSGVYKPAGPNADDQPFPGIAAGFFQGSKLDTFRSENPNGTWRLFGRAATQGGLGGLLSGGWSLEIETAPDCAGKNTTIAGTPANDVLRGTPKSDVFVGLGGKDKILGLGGNDVLCGGGGKDLLLGGAGRDRLIGQGGKDRCSGGKGNDNAARTCEKAVSA